MSRITMTLLMIFLSSCKPNLSPVIFPDLVFFLNEDGTIDREQSRCRLRCVDIDRPFKQVDDVECGEDFISGDYDITECDGLTGVYVETLGEKIIPFAKELKRFGEDECRL